MGTTGEKSFLDSGPFRIGALWILPPTAGSTEAHVMVPRTSPATTCSNTASSTPQSQANAVASRTMHANAVPCAEAPKCLMIDPCSASTVKHSRHRIGSSS